ncbi:serine/threonine protein phosphatase [Methylobacterium sp. C25]|uniref:metallophosphoesterase family protein n=1 Tax=Methylobacterium sp. C25 TaxID=2721622 RepID=UPI001F316A3A|nr:metallophosphoesterase family protein [Methylobacterium sp. C25]MCE4225004.1 serine/threonine protein phosphatase [Methylobacterium sp. C25]
MTFTYAVPDLHGRFDLFEKAISAIGKRGGGKVVFTGDYVDRGPESRQIIEALIFGAPEGQSWICLKGNHEDMMVKSCSTPLDPDWWLSNGGAATVRSYGAGVSLTHLRWADRLPLYHEDEHRVFVHAGLDPSVSMPEQREQILCWYRCPRDFDYSLGAKHVVHGHTPFRDGPILLPGRSNFDTYAVGTGRLVIGVFDDAKAGGPVEVIEVLELQPLKLEGR